MSTTYEEACKCPKCGLPGDVRSKSPARGASRPGAVVHMVYCVNDKCVWYDTSWVIQVNSDGSIPEPTVTHKRGDVDKLFPGRPSDEMTERAIASVQRQLDLETQQGGGEISNPHTPRH
jgi:hypothetical protein